MIFGAISDDVSSAWKRGALRAFVPCLSNLSTLNSEIKASGAGRLASVAIVWVCL